MAMPNDLIFIRHGQSEASIVQKSDEHGVDMEVTKQLFGRPDGDEAAAASPTYSRLPSARGRSAPIPCPAPFDPV